MTESEKRVKQITKTSVIGIIVNVFLSAFKAVVGFFAGALSVVLDAVNNLSDALSSLLTLIGIKLAGRKPDKKHPFGHGRVEYFTTVIIAVIILITGFTSLVESVKKIIHPTLPKFSAITWVVISVAIVVKLLLGRFVKSQGKKYNSDTLIASGSDALFDALISFATIVGGLVAVLTKHSIDGIVGALIALFIIKAGFEMLFEAVSDMVGKRTDSEVSKSIRKTIASVDGVLGVYDLIIHNYGPDHAIGSVHIEISSELSADEIYKITRKIQFTVASEYQLFLTVGIYAIDKKYQAERDEINRLALAHAGVLQTHGIYVDDELKLVSVDVVTDFSIRDKEGLATDLKREISGVFGGYNVLINFDTSYTD